MSTKSVLLSMFEADIEIATGNDKEDLQAVRNWISRAEDISDKAKFMAHMRSIQTLAEKDAYIRATEWKRRQR